MEQTQDQITNLLKKIEQQDELIAKLKSEEAKLGNYVKQFKEAMEKKMNKEQGTTPRTAADDEKLQKQMEKQLENARLMLKNYQNQLKALQKKSGKNTFTADDLIQMEGSIKKKEEYVRELIEDIKNLNAVKRKQQKLIDKKQKNEEGAKLSRLVEETRKQKQILQTLKIKHKTKLEILEKRKQAIDEMEKQYIQKCKQQGVKPLNFEEFKERRVHKKREESVSRLHSQNKKKNKKPLTIRDIINSHLTTENVEISEKGLNELRQKKTVAQNSLKIARKKYEKEIEELEERIESLKRQNQTFNTKYLEKKKQKELIQTSKTVDFKKNSSRTTKKLEPIK